jgi:histidinol-phosphatase (PHP family)
MIADYHIHTRLCRHAEGEPREYVERAVALGMMEMGFADHLPFLGGWEPRHDLTDDWAMGLDELDDYVTLVQELAREYAADVRILLGIEADFIPETLDDTASVLAGYPFDYVIGSVHIVGDRFGFDHPEMEPRLADYGLDRIYLESLELARCAAESGLFDVVGHLDHAKKYARRPDDDEAVAAAASAALRAVAAAGMAVELNTAGWRKPVGESYPGPALLAEAAGLGIPLVVGSDAHRPGDVGHGFARAAEVARAAGYDTLLRLSARTPEAIA